MITRLPIDVPDHPLTPEQINPGLAPAIDEAPEFGSYKPAPSDAQSSPRAGR